MDRRDGAASWITGLVYLHLEEAHVEQTRHYNKSRRNFRCEIGDRVFKRITQLSSKQKNITAKLGKRLPSPFRIIKARSALVYELANDNSRSLGTFHIQDLKLNGWPRGQSQWLVSTRKRPPERWFLAYSTYPSPLPPALIVDRAAIYGRSAQKNLQLFCTRCGLSGTHRRDCIRCNLAPKTLTPRDH